jgi:flavin-dependent dehydrogenase
MRRRDEPIEVVGAGPAGLAAAITLARGGRRVVLHEARPGVGHRFGDDLQGLENWTTTMDALDWLRELGITADFAQLASTRVTAFDAWGGTHPIRGRQPLFYLVVRGPSEGSLDSALLKQAREVGVDVRFNSRKTRIEGPGVLATGPKAADAIAVGYHFETDMSDGIWMILDDFVAPKGYSYLLVMHGRGTVKSCMFSGFKQERMYVERTVDRFQRLIGLDMRNPTAHGGVGNFRLPATAVSGGRPIAGEQAGFQDAFAGFGMRYAILSGVMSARALLGGAPYDLAWRGAMQQSIETSVVNRALYSALGNRGYRWLLRSQSLTGDTRAFMRWLYGPGRFRKLLGPWAERRFSSRRHDASCDHAGCACVWCRCGKPHGSPCAEDDENMKGILK